MKMKKWRRKNKLLVEWCYAYHFPISGSSFLVHHHGEELSKKYLFRQKILLKVFACLTIKKALFVVFWWFSVSISDELWTVSLNWISVFENSFHSDNVLRSKNQSYESCNYYILNFPQSYIIYLYQPIYFLCQGMN